MSHDPRQDEQFMRQAIRLAMAGRGMVEPNPAVGCLIVKDGRVIGQGYHRKFGEAHAEPQALTACQESTEGATAYITLEPCCHTDKKTPPCVPRLIEARLTRVVVGCLDPNPAVSGRGIAALRQAGTAVTIGVAEALAKQLISPYLARIVHGRPYVTLKWAQSADGKVAGPASVRLQIAAAPTMRRVHELRAHSDVVMVGMNTVLRDDPELTARNVAFSRNPIRAVLDTNLRFPATCKLAAPGGPATVVFCSADAPDRQRIESVGVQVIPVGLDSSGHVSLNEVLRELTRRWTATHVLVEPGPTLAAAFLKRGLADRVWVIRSPTVVGDESAPAAVPVPLPAVGQMDLKGDVLTEYLNPASEVYFAASPSPDFIAATPK